MVTPYTVLMRMLPVSLCTNHSLKQYLPQSKKQMIFYISILEKSLDIASQQSILRQQMDKYTDMTRSYVSIVKLKSG